MKRWTAMACATILVGCVGPQISLTDTSPRQVAFLVHHAWLVPLRDVDALAANYCRQHGQASRQANARWIALATKQVTYECVGAAGTAAPQPEVRPAPVARHAHQKMRKSAVGDVKAAAWTKAKAATGAWAQCLRSGAERKAVDTAEAAQLVALAVVHACSELEYAVHEPLEAIGEDSTYFQADLHQEALQNAADTVTSVRTKAELPAAEPSAIRSEQQARQ